MGTRTTNNNELTRFELYRRLIRIADDEPVGDVFRRVEHFLGIPECVSFDERLRICRVLLNEPRDKISRLFVFEMLKFPDSDANHVQFNPHYVIYLECLVMFTLNFLQGVDPDDVAMVCEIVGKLYSVGDDFLERGRTEDHDNLFDALESVAGDYAEGSAENSTMQDILPAFTNMFLNTCCLIATSPNSVPVAMTRLFFVADVFVKKYRQARRSGQYDGWFGLNMERLRMICEM